MDEKYVGPSSARFSGHFFLMAQSAWIYIHFEREIVSQTVDKIFEMEPS